MTEIFQREAGTSTAGLPASGTFGVNANAMEWQETGVEGFRIKPLFEDRATGMRTWLMQVDPGASAPLHQHQGEVEQIYVVQGSFHDQERTWRAGEYAIRAPGADHTAGSADGALVLLFYTQESTS